MSWLEELARYLQIWFVCFGMTVALRRGELVGTRFVVNLLAPLPQRIVLAFGKTLILIFLVVFIYSGSTICRHLIEINELAPNLRIPIVYAHIPFPMAGVLMLLFTVISLLRDIVGMDIADQLQQACVASKGVD